MHVVLKIYVVSLNTPYDEQDSSINYFIIKYSLGEKTFITFGTDENYNLHVERCIIKKQCFQHHRFQYCLLKQLLNYC